MGRPDTVLQRILNIKPHGMFATIIAAAQAHALLMISQRQKKLQNNSKIR
jgi:hypothetical protein